MSPLRMGLPEDGAVSPQTEGFLTTGFRCHLPAPVEVLQILLTSAPPLPQSNTQTTRPLASPQLVFMEAILCQALGGGTDGGTREHKDAGRAPARENPRLLGVGWGQMLFRTQQRRQADSAQVGAELGADPRALGRQGGLWRL